MVEKSKEYYEFKKQLSFLKKQKGQGTELISVYIKPAQNVNEVAVRLRDEHGQAANIKSKQTRKNVQAAIDRILTMLKGVHKSPEHGVAIFCGSINNNIELFNIIPPDEIQVSIYRCDSSFFTEPLEDMMAPKQSYGLFTMDRREATIAVLKGKKITILHHLNSTVPGKHNKGGQSAMRFSRLIESAAQDFYKKIGEIINQEFAGKEVTSIIAGGPGPTKYDFLSADYIFTNVKAKIIGSVDTSYTDESGIKEVVDKAGELIQELEVNKEKDLLNKFLKEAATDGLATYGEDDVKRVIQSGQASRILLSEKLPEEKVEEISAMVEQTSAEIEMVSVDTPEGEQFYTAFGGIGAFLRFKMRE